MALTLALTLAVATAASSSAATADESAALTFLDGSIAETSSGNGYTIDGTTLTITAAGTYRIGGSCSEGSIVVSKGLSDVTLILDDLTLASSTTAPIVIKKSSAVNIHLEGTSFQYYVIAKPVRAVAIPQ